MADQQDDQENQVPHDRDFSDRVFKGSEGLAPLPQYPDLTQPPQSQTPQQPPELKLHPNKDRALMANPRPTVGELAQTNPEVKAWMDQAADGTISQRDRAFGNENETERALCGQLMLVTTVLLSANIVVLSNADLMRLMSSELRIITCGGVGLLLVSMFSGMQYYSALVKFHRGWGQAYQDRATYIRSGKFHDFKELERKERRTFKKLNNVQSQRWLNIQKRSLWAALIVYPLLLGGVMFDLRWLTVPVNDWIVHLAPTLQWLAAPHQ